jgi:tripartite-type tricarboxylate transporter receptor subunit TctC
MNFKYIASAITAIAAACLVQGAIAQEFPTRQVRIVSALPVGSGPDAATRVLAEKLSRYWGQPVIVDARPGGAGFISAEAVKGGSTEGYDLLLSDNGFVAINPSLYQKFPFDFERDFEPASLFFKTPFFIAVGANSPLSNAKDLTAAAMSKPGALSYGSPRIGSPSHLGGALYESLTNTKMIHVPFTETSQLFASVASGNVTWALGSVATTRSLVDAKKIKLIAVASNSRDPAKPDVPTVAEAGGPSNFEVTAWVGLFTRKGTPQKTLDKINESVARALSEPDVKKFMVTAGYTPVTSSRKEFADLIKKDIKSSADLVVRAGAKAD